MRWMTIGLGLIGLLVLFSLVLPGIGNGPPGPRTVCLNNLYNISIALQMYRDRYGSLPPACIRDADGRPMHSWRALLLPYLDRQDIYELYRFDEPWDGPNNSRFHDIAMGVLFCPKAGERLTNTSYVAVTGPGTIWGDDVPLDWSQSEAWDRLDQTIMIVETTNSRIHWLEPRDIPISEIAPIINSAQGKGISSKHARLANVLFADGCPKSLPEKLSAATLHALLTVSGGEHVNAGEY